MGVSLSGCFLQPIETCGIVTSYGTNYNGGYVIIKGDAIYVDDLFFSKVEVGDDVCIIH